MATIKSIVDELANEPPPQRKKSPQYLAVDEAFDVIKRSLAQGWTFSTLCERFRDQGIDISESTLRKHYNAILKQRRKAERKARKKAKEHQQVEPVALPLDRSPSDYTAGYTANGGAIDIPPPLVSGEILDA